MRNTILVLALAAITTIGHAQPGMFGNNGRPKRGGNPAMMRQRIEDLRKLKLMDVLSLQGDQVEKFFGTYNPLQKSMLDAKDAMDAASKELWEATERKATAADLEKLTNELLQKMTSFERAINARHEGVRKVLSVEQYARYLAFEARFRDELERMILKKARDRRDRD